MAQGYAMTTAVPREPKPTRDKITSADGMSVEDLELMLQDIQNQPDWRDGADKCMAYMDGKQLAGERLAQLEETGEPKTVVNLVQRTINGALGNEAKVRLDWKAGADTDAFADVGEAVNERLHEAQRETYADTAISEAYKSQLGAGIGWVEVSRNPDPLAYPYRAECVHRNEVWWDWRHRLLDINSGRWVCRQRWIDVDEAIEWMPEHRDVFEHGCYSGPITDAFLTRITSSETFDDLSEQRRLFNRFEEEWLDNSTRRRVRFYDIHYKQPHQVVALISGTTRRIFNPKNPLHLALVQRGLGQLVKGPSFIIRRALFAGPFRLFDEPTKLRKFPLVPFWCYRDDADGTPYGLIHGMIDPQDEYNERRSRLRWLLRAAQVFVDNDALDQKFNTFKQLALEIMRPDAVVVLNALRKGGANGIKVERNLQLAQEQIEVMQDAKQLIQDVPGLYNALLGSGTDGVKSGVAFNSLVEQSITSLGETNDNYRSGRRLTGEALCDLITGDMGAPNLTMRVGTGRKQRWVVLNTFDDDGLPRNHVDEAPVKIGLADIPSTPAHRQQQRSELTTALQGLGDDPIARAILVPAFIESTDLENRDHYAKWARKKYGVPEPGGDENEVSRADAAEEQMSQINTQLQVRGAVADVSKKEADAQKTAAQAQLEQAKVDQIRLSTAHDAMRPLAEPPSEDEQIDHALDMLD